MRTGIAPSRRIFAHFTHFVAETTCASVAESDDDGDDIPAHCVAGPGPQMGLVSQALLSVSLISLSLCFFLSFLLAVCLLFLSLLFGGCLPRVCEIWIKRQKRCVGYEFHHKGLCPFGSISEIVCQFWKTLKLRSLTGRVSRFACKPFDVA